MHFKIKTINNRKYLYVIKNERINGKVVQTIQKSVGSADKVYQLLTSNKPMHIASYSFGKPAAFIKAAEEVGLIESLNKHINRKNMAGLTPAEYLLLTIIGRSEHALSRNVLDDYFEKSSLQFIWSPKHKLSSQNFLNYMEKLDEETIRKIELDVSRALIKQGIKPTRLIFDTTNFYTHIEHGENLPQKSKSKDKRYDKNLIGVGLTISDQNIPFQSVTYPANKHDAKLFPELIDDICERLQEIKVPAEDMILVFDRGMNSSGSIGKAIDKMHVVGSLPASMCKNELQIPVSEYAENWKNGNGNIIKAHYVTGNWYETDLVGVVKYNDSSRRKQAREWEKNKVKISEKIEDIRSKLNRKGRGRKMTAKGLMNRVVDAIPKQYRGLFDYSVLEVEGNLQLKFELNETKEEEFIVAMGKTVVFTDKTDFTARQIVEIYDTRNTIESDIRWLKDKLLIPLKPTYVRKDVMIRAHVFLCVMGLLLYNYLLYLIEDDGLSIMKLADYLDQMRLGLVFNDKNSKNAEFIIEDMNKETVEVFSKLQLGRYIPD
ncbi:MAG: IS1634 family transposase [Desulfobacterales bacterium]|jgi:transposase|nr:IS1634 family transposase [Desulfobacterales bacterium]